MIIPQLNSVFVHIPKTAGQSIELCLLKHLNLSRDNAKQFLLSPNSDPSVGPPRLAHLTAGECVSLGYMSEEAFNGAYKFAFVRNPWNRLVSEYKFRERSLRVSFKDWVLRDFPTPGWSDPWRHVMPQANYLYGENGELQVDFVGRFENLENGMRTVRLGLGQHLPPLPRVNQNNSNSKKAGLAGLAKILTRPFYTRKDSTRNYFDPVTDGFVREFYAEDIERFGYNGGVDTASNSESETA